MFLGFFGALLYLILFLYFHLPKDCKVSVKGEHKDKRPPSCKVIHGLLYKDEKCLFILLHLVGMKEINIFLIVFHKPLKPTQITHLYLYFKQLHPLITTK